MKFVALTLLLASPLAADTRIFGGSVATSWKTFGEHGHDQPPCEPIDLVPGAIYPDCDDNDFARANLDNSIGFRGGFERDLRVIGRANLFAGVEGALAYTEYNLSQQDVTVGLAAATIGAELPLWRFRAGGKLGAGPFATNDGEQLGGHWFGEVFGTLPITTGTGMRISWRSTTMLNREERDGTKRSPRMTDVGILLVASPSMSPGAESAWQFAASTGASFTGILAGEDRELGRAEFHRLAAYRRLPRDLQLQISWTGTAFESTEPSQFLGFPGNFRTKVIDAYGAGVRAATDLDDMWSVHYGGAIEIADWEDDHRLLLDEDGGEVIGGIEIGLGINVATRLRMARYLSLEAGVEQVFWPGIEVGELRAGIGVVFTP